MLQSGLKNWKLNRIFHFVGMDFVDCSWFINQPIVWKIDEYVLLSREYLVDLAG
jgi:hypothetical protein